LIFFKCLVLFISSVAWAQTPAPGVLLDKIALVINEQAFTLSEFVEVQKTYSIRSEVAPIVYPPGKSSSQDLADNMIRMYIIRQKLKDIGYNITDDIVEERIGLIEKAQGLSRNNLITFLKARSIEFTTYFQLIKESIEMTQYMQKIIYPTIDVSDQEIKNFFIKNFPSASYRSIKYNLIAVTLPPKYEKNYSLKEVIGYLKASRDGVSLPANLQNIESQQMNQVDDSSLSKNIAKALKNTEIGQFSEVVKIQNKPTIFFVENKEFARSSVFESEKDNLKQQLAFEKAQLVLGDWMKSEMKNFYISNYL